MHRSNLLHALLLAALAATPSQGRAQASPQTRDGFFIGVGGGVGSFGCEACGERETGVAGHLKLGGTVRPDLLIGFETNGWTKDRGGARLTQTNVGAIVQYYPAATRGFFLNMGVGVSVLEASASGGGFTVVSSDTGLGLTGGLGYDVRIGSNVSVGPYALFAWGDVAGGGADHGQVGIGLTWH